MSAYCSLDEVYPLVAALGQLSTTTKPSKAQGEALLDDCATEIDGVLAAQGYELPITDDDALVYLASVNAAGGAAFILKAKYPVDTGAGSDAGSSGFWMARYTARLEAIKAGALGDEAEVETGTFAHGFRDSDGVALVRSKYEYGF